MSTYRGYQIGESEDRGWFAVPAPEMQAKALGPFPSEESAIRAVNKARDENETTEMWKDHRRAQQERRADRLPAATEEILALNQAGFTVQKLTDYQFRVNGRLDLFPTHRRYHDVVANRRGSYSTARAIAERVCGARAHA